MIEYYLILPFGYFFYNYFSEDEKKGEQVVEGRRYTGDKDK